MTTYQVRLTQSQEIAAGTMAFHFDRPPDFPFRPGQAIDLILIDSKNLDQEDCRHTFSIVSAPFQDELVIATRMRDSAYKRALQALPPGSSARIEGPFGALTLHKSPARPAVFVAGGIGITPFMSILRQAAQDRFPQQLLLLYSNRRPEDAAFLDELQQLAEGNERFRLVATMTDIGKSARPWDGATGVIDAAFVKEATGHLLTPIYYVAGPPAMVESMRKVLISMSVDEDDIRSEDFYGY